MTILVGGMLLKGRNFFRSYEGPCGWVGYFFKLELHRRNFFRSYEGARRLVGRFIDSAQNIKIQLLGLRVNSRVPPSCFKRVDRWGGGGLDLALPGSPPDLETNEKLP